MTQLLRFRYPNVQDAAKLLAWRTRPDIAARMFSDVPNDLDRQRDWLSRVGDRSDYRHFIIQSDGRDIGYLSYAAIDPVNRHCQPGFYIGDDNRSAQAAGSLHWYIMNYAFHRLGMNKVISQIMDCNPRLVRSMRLLRMTEVGVQRRHVLKADGWHDVHLFELHRADWDQQPQPFALDQVLAAFPP